MSTLPVASTGGAPNTKSWARPAVVMPSTNTPSSSPSATPSTSRPPTPTTVQPAAPSTTRSPSGARIPTTHRAPATTASPAFSSTISTIDAALAGRMTSTYHPGCPVPLSHLRYLTMSYWGFDGRPHSGEMVVSARVADDVVAVFRRLYDGRWPIRSMRLVDDFGGSDDASMAADNTSAFNCRAVTGGSSWSQHSYGEAIDLDPLENPYISGSTVEPPGAARYLGRPDLPGVIHAADLPVRAFAAIGWTWGGTWTSPKDLQHFSLSGR